MVDEIEKNEEKGDDDDASFVQVKRTFWTETIQIE